MGSSTSASDDQAKSRTVSTWAARRRTERLCADFSARQATSQTAKPSGLAGTASSPVQQLDVSNSRLQNDKLIARLQLSTTASTFVTGAWLASMNLLEKLA